jgi:dTDP-4-amino-4,6-dideoxygalactose transaminase
MQPYRSYFPHAGLLLPQTERLASRVMSLPNGTAVGAMEIQGICGLVRFALEHAAEIRVGLQASEPVLK